LGTTKNISTTSLRFAFCFPKDNCRIFLPIEMDFKQAIKNCIPQWEFAGRAVPVSAGVLAFGIGARPVDIERIYLTGDIPICFVRQGVANA
jgi:hypothetical protein